MPCEGGPSIDNSWIEVDRLTRIACEMGKLIRREGLANLLPTTSLRWLIEHEREDRRLQSDSIHPPVKLEKQ